MAESPKARAKRLLDCYNCTPEDWDKIFAFQRGVCFICGRPSRTGRLATDHRHSDGLLRGLLCSQCNRVIGKIEDPRWQWTVEHLKRLIIYLVNPPAIEALGREIFGYPGKIGTERHRKWIRRKLKSMTPLKP